MHPYLYFINTLMIYAYSPYAPPRSVDRLALFICKPDRFLILIAIHCTFHNVTHFMCCTHRNDELSCDISLDFIRFKHNTRYNTPLNRASPQLIEVGASCPAALVKNSFLYLNGYAATARLRMEAPCWYRARKCSVQRRQRSNWACASRWLP